MKMFVVVVVIVMLTSVLLIRYIHAIHYSIYDTLSVSVLRT